MASWMVHIRVADKLLDCFDGIDKTAFVVGNIAPDSGVPNEDWSAYFPPKKISHFYKKNVDGGHDIDVDRFIAQYFTVEQQERYTAKEYSFYLGYLTHLLTDVEWVERIYRPGCRKYAEEYEQDEMALTWKFKEDWYDLDFLYLKKNPTFRAFCIYENAKNFENQYMDIFSRDAFENRREYITGWYRADKDNLEREYTYLTEEQAEQFVADTAAAIVEKLKNSEKIVKK